MSLAMKVFFMLGGIGLIWGFVSKGVPQMIAWLLPLVVKVVHQFMAWLLAKPAIKKAAIAYKPQIKDLLKNLEKGFEEIFDAALAAVDEDLDKAENP